MIQINNGFNEYYYLLEDGTIYNSSSNRIIKPNKKHLFNLKTIDNKSKKIALKTLYRLIFNKPFCVDHIPDLDHEIWKEIDYTDGLYLISNKGRVKSYYGYEAIILKPYKNKAGY